MKLLIELSLRGLNETLMGSRHLTTKRGFQTDLLPEGAKAFINGMTLFNQFNPNF
jgi:hypothetical protein